MKNELILEFNYSTKQFMEKGNLISLRNITDRIHAEQIAREAQTYAESVVTNFLDTLIVVDRKAEIQTVNPETCRLLGYSEEELIGTPIGLIFAEEEEEVKKFFQFFRDVDPSALDASSQLRNVGVTYLTKEGKRIPMSFNASILLDSAGNVTGVVAGAKDLSERIEAEKERQKMELKLLSNSKLASLGEIATGIAHEINQPLTYISSMMQVLLFDLKNDEFDEAQTKKDMTMATKQVDRITKIIDHLRTFGRKEEATVMDSVSLVQVLDDSQLLLAERLRLRNIKLVRKIDENLPLVMGDLTKLEQIFINLFQNSIDALTTPSGHAELDSTIEISMTHATTDQFVQLRFSDNGAGMPDEVREKIFEPFFTTKEVGKGTGVGLSIVYGLVQEHNGSISCSSKLGEGTTFTLQFPIAS